MNEQKECIKVKLTCGVDYYKGEKPIKGVDYFTEEDIAEIAEYIQTEGIDLTDYATKVYVDEAIEQIDLTDYATKVYVDEAIEQIDLTDYATKAYVDEAIEQIDYPTYQAGNGIDINGYTVSVDTETVATHTWVDNEIITNVPAWAMQGSKPTYTASEVGALPANTPIPSKTSDLTNDSGFLTSFTETDPTVPSWAKQATKPIYTASEVGALPANTALFSGDYEDLTNKPTIPTVPTNVSAFTNDAGYLTSHQSLTDYATKSYVEQVVAGIETGMLKRSVVQALPTQDIDSNTIYMVSRTNSETNNVYDEYLYVNNSWEKIGSTDVDLTDYATESYVDTAIANIPQSTTYTFTNGLSESNGTVGWNLSDRIAAGVGTNSAIIGDISSNTASGICSLAEGKNNKAYGDYSHVEGLGNTANISYAHAEGSSNTAYGNSAHAEGISNTVDGMGAHAEGFANTTYGLYAHVEGRSNSISTTGSEAAHAEGYNNTIAGAYTHVEGQYNKAHNGQHVEGKFNQEDSNYVFQHIAGNGANAVSRSNAYALGRDGNGYYSGNLFVGCNDYSTTYVNSAGQLITANAGGSKVATESYVASAISAIPSTTYTLPVSTTSTLGGVKIDGSTITIDSNGVISTTGTFSGDYNDLTNKPTIPAAYTLPTATTAVLGGVMVDGSSITVDGNGVISATSSGGSSYTAGSGIDITNDVISSYSLDQSNGLFLSLMGQTWDQYSFLYSSLFNGSTKDDFITCVKNGRVACLGFINSWNGLGTDLKNLGFQRVMTFSNTGQFSILDITKSANANWRPNRYYGYWACNQYIIMGVEYEYSGVFGKGISNNLYYNNSTSGLSASTIKGAIDEVAAKTLPTAPSTDGTYFLSTTISSGTATYSWENVVIGGSY